MGGVVAPLLAAPAALTDPTVIPGGLPASRVIGSEDSAPSDIVMLFLVVAIAAIVPVLLRLLRLPIPEVVVLLVVGALLGQSVAGLIIPTDALFLLQEIGIGFLFFMAGFELNPVIIRGAEGRLAGWGWFASLAVALAAAAYLMQVGLVRSFVGIAIALTTTALGTLIPILRDSGELGKPFGRNVLASGAAGEIGPIIAMTLFLSSRSSWTALISLTIFLLIALLFLLMPSLMRVEKVREAFHFGRFTTAQTAVRWTMLLLIGLLALASVIGLDLVLGAFIAGLMFRVLTKEGELLLQRQLEGIAFGLFIPLFFVVSGASLNVPAMIGAPGLVLTFLLLILAARGLPQMLVYRRAMPDLVTRTRFSLYTATTLPLLVAVTTIEVSSGLMTVQTEAALVGAGLLSVLLFPTSAQALAWWQRRGEQQHTETSDGPGPEAAAGPVEPPGAVARA